MGRYSSDDSGVPHTCPLIDEIIDAVKNVEWTDEHYYTEKGLLNTLEQIRTHNGNLRDWGSNKNQEIHDLNEEVDDLRDEVRRLTEQLTELNYEIRDLNEIIDDLSSE